jgi:hypothetical protein
MEFLVYMHRERTEKIDNTLRTEIKFFKFKDEKENQGIAHKFF